MTVFSSLVLSALLATGAASESGQVPFGCEPGGDIEASAEAVSIVQSGSTTRVTVELTVMAIKQMPEATVRGHLLGGRTFQEEFGMPDRVRTFHKKTPKKLRYNLTLENGKEHHLFFTVRGKERPGATIADAAAVPETTAYLRVNLDPELEPERRGDKLQYKAKMEN